MCFSQKPLRDGRTLWINLKNKPQVIDYIHLFIYQKKCLIFNTEGDKNLQHHWCQCHIFRVQPQQQRTTSGCSGVIWSRHYGNCGLQNPSVGQTGSCTDRHCTEQVISRRKKTLTHTDTHTHARASRDFFVLNNNCVNVAWMANDRSKACGWRCGTGSFLRPPGSERFRRPLKLTWWGAPPCAPVCVSVSLSVCVCVPARVLVVGERTHCSSPAPAEGLG